MTFPIAETFSGYISGTTLTVTSVTANQPVIVPMLITWNAGANSTYILAQGTGTGGTGTYTVSTSQTVGSSGSPTTFTGTVIPIVYEDYNAIQTIVYNIMSVYTSGGGVYPGYGQILNSSQLAGAGGKVKVSDWNNLYLDITNLNYHQLGVATSPALTIPTTSTDIREVDKIAYGVIASALANSSSTTVNGVTYPGCYATPPGTMLASTTGLSSPLNNFPYTAYRVGSSYPWGGSTITNPNPNPTASAYIVGNIMTTTAFPSASLVAGMTVTGSGVASGTKITSVNTCVFSGYIVNSTLTITSITSGTLAVNMMLYGGGTGDAYGGVTQGTIINGFAGGSQWYVNLSQSVGGPGLPSPSRPFIATSYSVNISQSVATTTMTYNLNVIESNIQTINNVFTVTWNGGTYGGGGSYTAAQAAQYFFNSGGLIQFTASMSEAGTSTASATIPATYPPATVVPANKNDSWYTLLNNMGTISFGLTGTRSATTTAGNTSNGWNYFLANKGGSYVTIYTASLGSSGSVLYAPNQYDILAKLDAGGSVLTFKIELQDLSTAATEDTYKSSGNTFDIDEDVTGTVAAQVNITYASGSHVTANQTTGINTYSYLPTVAQVSSF